MDDVYERMAGALEVTGQLIGTAGIACVLIAIASLARKRGLEQLRENASVRTGAFVALMIGSIAIQHWAADRAPDVGIVTFVTFVAAAAALYAMAIAAKLCAEAAKIVDGDPVLPAAKLVS